MQALWAPAQETEGLTCSALARGPVEGRRRGRGVVLQRDRQAGGDELHARAGLRHRLVEAALRVAEIAAKRGFGHEAEADLVGDEDHRAGRRGERGGEALAKKIGCTVITTVGSNDKIEKAKALGADHVINYREDRFEGVVRKLTKKKGVDVVFEHVGKDTWAGSMLCLKRGGRLVTCGSTSGVSTDMNLMMLFQQQLKLLGSFGCRMENMADAMQKMARGIVHPVIDTEVTFDGIETALERMESRQIFGKIVLKLD